ncbi:hypothetical protein MUO66_02845 [Candidatus Bathyarchaeota archaeon]|nr:hypothetical protein [Candidatus Bathyarchaeota archaeon]
MKISATTTKINETIAEPTENKAKLLQSLTNSNRDQRATIPIIFKNPEATTRIKCIFPLYVRISPPTSSGKKNATKTPRNPLIRKIIGHRNEPDPLFSPQCNPR